jgi:hypothetical protein
VSEIKSFVALGVTTPIRMFADQMQTATPHTFNAMQRLVMSMADTVKNVNKKTFFGRDKGVESYTRFLSALKLTIRAMVLDGVVQESTPAGDVLTSLDAKMVKFAMAFPNWKDAYGFAAYFFEEQRVDALSIVERLRSAP